MRAHFGRRTTYVVAAMAVLFMVSAARAATPQKKEYLSDAEADKIRDAGSTGPRIVLYTTFAGNRIKKLQYEFAHIDPADKRLSERVNALLIGYSGCLDDATDLLEEGIEKQADIRGGVKEMQSHTKEFLMYLQELAQKGPEVESYKENLDDAIESTQDAIKDVEKASRDMAPPPVRRKQ